MSSAGLPTFHDAPVSHTHQQSNNCFRFQRSHGLELSRCSSRMSVMYCRLPASRPTEAQWGLQKERLLIENCAIAAMELPQCPHMEEETIICIRMRQKRDPTCRCSGT
ncbi:hypothetical protein B0H19DRAFT_1074243 [Mycena capillaripes]|nr:hypothetical protein B0H19DRAFT_1074243 [Mycena capillaripes]